MLFEKTSLKGAFIVDLNRIEDDRGFFARTFCANEFQEHGLNTEFVQANMSLSREKYTLRGMHYQVEGAEEAKLVRCTKGSILDVIIDIRKDSDTYCQYLSVELTDSNYRMLYVPEGFAHGFITLEDNIEVTYMVSNFYTPGKERGIRWNDPLFGIEWPTASPLLSPKDANHPDYVK